MPARDIPSDSHLQVGLLLLEGFSLSAYTSIIEPLQVANRLTGKTLYSFTHLSLTGGPTKSGHGMIVSADTGVGDVPDLDILFILGAGDPLSFNDPQTFEWLRRLARADVQLACATSGTFMLARAGLLEGYRFTLHWALIPAFLKLFPRLTPENQLYVFDRTRLTCAGANLDMTIGLIERDRGHELAAGVSDWFLFMPRPGHCAQRMSLRERYHINNDKLLRVLAHMEAHVEEVEDRRVLTKIAGLSSRQLDRLFETHLHASLGEIYRRIRLDHATMLLRRTGMSVTEVAIACGFTSSSHFSRCFKARYGLPPRASR